jgi:hypothetical protein
VQHGCEVDLGEGWGNVCGVCVAILRRVAWCVGGAVYLNHCTMTPDVCCVWLQLLCYAAAVYFASVSCVLWRITSHILVCRSDAVMSLAGAHSLL